MISFLFLFFFLNSIKLTNNKKDDIFKDALKKKRIKISILDIKQKIIIPKEKRVHDDYL